MKQALKYGAVLIGAYIVIANGTNFGRAFTAASTGSSGIIKTLQGR